jgi:hypothetical protein
MLTPVPLGVQMAWLSCKSTGTPPTRTRVAAVTHWAMTQGMGLPAGVVKGQPTTLWGAFWVTTIWPITLTLGLGAVA